MLEESLHSKQTSLDESWITNLLEWADKNHIPKLKLIEIESYPKYNTI